MFKHPYLSNTLLLTALLVAISTSFQLRAEESMLPCEEEVEKVLQQTPENEVKLISAFKPAKAIKRVNPKYPTSAARIGAEGWVQMSFVVDTEGKVKDPVVEDFGGNTKFKRAAISALKKWQFQPAIKDGKPTEQCSQSIQFDFTLGNASGANKSFIKQYKLADEMVNAGKYAEADKLIQKLHNDKNTNRYENSWLWNIDATLASKLKDKKREEKSLWRTIASSKSHRGKSRSFNEEYIGYLHQRLFNLQVNIGLYGYALKTAKLMESLDNAEALLKPLEDTLISLKGLIASEQNLFLQVELDEEGQYFHRLARNKFAFSNILGRVDTAEVRCDSRREKFTVAENHIWNIPESWGACQVMIKGKSKASFDLVEVGQAAI